MAAIRQDHEDQIVRWANFVRDNPTKWKRIHTEFIDSIFDKHKQFVKQLSKTKEGKEKLVSLYNIKNKKAFSFLN